MSRTAPSSIARAISHDHRRASWALWGTCAIAVASLPTLTFSPVWIAAFVTPALVFHLLRSRTRLSLPAAITLATLLHVGTVLLAQLVEDTIAHETALGCSLLPPLTYLAARRHGEDIVWALFLAMCVFLIALILGQPATWQVWAFLICGMAALSFESNSRAAAHAVAWQGSFARPAAAWGGALSIVIATVIVLALGKTGMESLAKSSREQRSAKRDTNGRRQSATARVGLNDRFEFGNAGIHFANLQADELLRVRASMGTLAAELYLRTTHFDSAGLDRWTATNAASAVQIPGEAIRHAGDEVAGARTREIDILLTGPVENYMFLPPGTLEVFDIDAAFGDLQQELFTRLPETSDRYSVRYQDRRALAAERGVAPGHDRLTRLPASVRSQRAHFDRLIEAARVDPDSAPLDIADAIIRALQADHSYALREPDGPYDDSLLNFLSGDRTGYCMHFASALAICLRLVGVPSRIGVGLYAGNAPRGAGGVISLGSQHAHAWVEVPIDELGWVVVDPTPPSMAGALEAAAEQTRVAAQLDAEMPDAAPSRWVAQRWLWIALAIGSSLTLVGLALSRRLRVALPISTRRFVDSAALQHYDAMLAELARWRPRSRGESIGEWTRSLAQFEAFPAATVRTAIVAYEEVRFGGRPFDSARASKITTAVDELRASRGAHLEATGRLDRQIQ